MANANRAFDIWEVKVLRCIDVWSHLRADVAPENWPIEYGVFYDTHGELKVTTLDARRHLSHLSDFPEADRKLMYEEWVTTMNARINAWEAFVREASADLKALFNAMPKATPKGKERTLRKKVAELFRVWEGPGDDDWVVWGRRGRSRSSLTNS